MKKVKKKKKERKKERKKEKAYQKNPKPDLNVWTKAIAYDFFLNISTCAVLSQRLIFKIIVKALNILCI